MERCDGRYFVKNDYPGLETPVFIENLCSNDEI